MVSDPLLPVEWIAKVGLHEDLQFAGKSNER